MNTLCECGMRCTEPPTQEDMLCDACRTESHGHVYPRALPAGVISLIHLELPPDNADDVRGVPVIIGEWTPMSMRLGDATI